MRETQQSEIMNKDNDLQANIAWREAILRNEKLCGTATSIHLALRHVRFLM
jgi:hypothetical protein